MARTTCLLALILALLAGAMACRRHDVPGQRAFYYWRTQFALSPTEKQALRTHRIDRLYLRLFDVNLDPSSGLAAPVASCRMRESVPAGIEVVPVVFIANRVFAVSQPKELADQVWRRVRDSAATAGFAFQELQVDCDWSDSTREGFFALCHELRGRASTAGVRLGATIRLHQIKYASRTGIPPVDRGMLMFYNLGQLSADPERSSILNLEDASRYVGFVDRYPLPLDSVLPIFSWAIHGRDGHIVELLDKADPAALAALPALQESAPGRFTAIRSSLFHGRYLREGDTVNLEHTTPELVRQAAQVLSRHLAVRGQDTRDGRPTTALFDLDERNLSNYAPADLESIFSLRP